MSQVTLTFTFGSESDALAFMQRNTPTVAEQPAPAPKAAAAAPAPKTEKAKPAAKAAAPAPAAIEYPVLQKAVFELAAKNKGAVMEVLAGLGVASAKELPADRYAEALAAVQAKTAELNAAAEVA